MKTNFEHSDLSIALVPSQLLFYPQYGALTLRSNFSLVICVTVGKLPFMQKTFVFMTSYSILWQFGADLSVFRCRKCFIHSIVADRVEIAR
jgi:hypothetical protein